MVIYGSQGAHECVGLSVWSEVVESVRELDGELRGGRPAADGLNRHRGWRVVPWDTVGHRGTPWCPPHTPPQTTPQQPPQTTILLVKTRGETSSKYYETVGNMGGCEERRNLLDEFSETIVTEVFEPGAKPKPSARLSFCCTPLSLQ